MACNRRGGRRSLVLGIACCLMVLAAAMAVPAPAAATEAGRYQVVAGTEDNGFLIDTVTGAVWILTYRAMPTGREPVAIPYKFIKISPKDGNPFLVEPAPEPAAPPRAK